MKILLISTQTALSDALSAELKGNGFAVYDASENDADARIATEHYEAIVLDPVAGDDSILSLIPIWRRQGITSAIFAMVDDSVSVKKRARCLDLGADFVLVRPIATAEVVARLRALARRHRAGENRSYHVADLELDPVGRTVRRGERVIRLTPREFELLEFLISRRGKIVTRSMIREHLFDNIGTRGSNVVDVYIRYLRKKIDRAPDPTLILTHWGKGYEFRGEAI